MGRFYTYRKMKVKKVILSLCSNIDSVADDVTSDGRLFQVFAAATQNARSPTVRRRVCGTVRSADDAERKRCRPGISATCCRLLVKYVRPRPFRHWNASTAGFRRLSTNHNPNVGSALSSSPFERRKFPSPHFFARSMSASRSRTCCSRLPTTLSVIVAHLIWIANY